MMSRRLRRSLPYGARLAALLLAAALGACSDDDPVPPSGDWTAESLPAGLEDATLYGLNFHGERGLAVGARGTSPQPPASIPVVLETGGQGWQAVSLPGLPDDAILTDVAFAGDAAVIVGAQYPSGAPLILDERGGWNRPTISGVSLGLLNAASAGNGTIRVVGISDDGVAVVSTAADTWTGEAAGFSSAPNDKGLVDLVFADGVFYGTGYDDAADGSPEEPYHVVMSNDGSSWDILPSPVEAGAWEVRAIAVTGEGVLLVGGAITDFSADIEHHYVAALVSRSSSGTWSTISLPQAVALDRVNDILVASDGRIFLACGLESIQLLVSTDGGFTIEGPGTPGRIEALAEDAEGSIYAAGFEVLGGDSVRALLLHREP